MEFKSDLRASQPCKSAIYAGAKWFVNCFWSCSLKTQLFTGAIGFPTSTLGCTNTIKSIMSTPKPSLSQLKPHTPLTTSLVCWYPPLCLSLLWGLGCTALCSSFGKCGKLGSALKHTQGISFLGVPLESFLLSRIHPTMTIIIKRILEIFVGLFIYGISSMGPPIPTSRNIVSSLPYKRPPKLIERNVNLWMFYINLFFYLLKKISNRIVYLLIDQR